MSQQNQMPIIISEVDQAEITSSLNNLSSILSKYALTLTPEERKSLLKFGDRSTAFVQKSDEFIGTHPEFLPSYVSAQAFKANLTSLSAFTLIEHTLNELLNGVENCRLVSGSEAYNTALIYYDATKKAAIQKIPAAQIIVDELAIRFQHKSKSGSESSPSA